jgi:hypothetical protein
LYNDQVSTKDLYREKLQQAQKFESDVRDMEAKLSRADRSVRRKLFFEESFRLK